MRATLAKRKQTPRFLSAEISQQVEFFKKDIILSFETETLFHAKSQPNTIQRPSILQKSYTNTYSDKHPTHCFEDADVLGVFNRTQTISARNIDVFAVNRDHNKAYFLFLKPKAKKVDKGIRIWLLSGQNGYVLFNPSESTLQFITSAVITRKSKELSILFNGSESNYSIKSFYPSDKKSDAINNFLDYIFDRNDQESFMMFIRSIQAFGTTPPICHYTLPFLRSVIENPQFLFLISMSSISRKQTDSNPQFLPSYIRICGHNLCTVTELMTYTYFNELKNDSSGICRSNSFMTSLLSWQIRHDVVYQEFLTSIDTSSDLILSFFECFESLKPLSPLSMYFLHVLFTKAQQMFTDPMAPYISISAILFLRVMIPHVMNNAKSSDVKALQFLINFDQTKDCVNSSYFERLKVAIYNKHYDLMPENLELIKAGFATSDDITEIIKMVESQASLLASTFQKYDFVSLIEQFQKDNSAK